MTRETWRLKKLSPPPLLWCQLPQLLRVHIEFSTVLHSSPPCFFSNSLLVWVVFLILFQLGSQHHPYIEVIGRRWPSRGRSHQQSWHHHLSSTLFHRDVQPLRLLDDFFSRRVLRYSSHLFRFSIIIFYSARRHLSFIEQRISWIHDIWDLI